MEIKANEVDIEEEELLNQTHPDPTSIALPDPCFSGSLTTLNLEATSPNHADGNENLVSKRLSSSKSGDISSIDDDVTKAHRPTRCIEKVCCVKDVEGKTAWLVACMGMVITFMIATEFSSFGIYYVEYTEYFQTTKGAVGLIKGIQTLSGGIFGLVGGSFVKVYGSRVMTIIGVMFTFTGFLTASFSPGIITLYLTQGVILGIGINMMNVSTVVILQRHFIRNPVLGTGLAFMGFTLGSMTSPIWVSALIDAYGIRGSLLIHSAVIAHGLPAAMLFRPPRNKGHQPKTETLFTQMKNELCDFSLLKNAKFMMVAWGGFCVYYAISSFVNHLPGRAVFYGYPRSKAAYLQSIISIASMVSRIGSTFLANMRCLNKIIFYCAVIWFVALAPFTYSFLREFPAITISPILFGIGMGSSTTVFYAVVVQLFGMEHLPKVVGFYSIATSLGLAVGPPLSGAMFDFSGNYDSPFLLAGCVGILGNFVYIGVWLLHRYQMKPARAPDVIDEHSV